jgi:hypothetical protein
MYGKNSKVSKIHRIRDLTFRKKVLKGIKNSRRIQFNEAVEIDGQRKWLLEPAKFDKKKRRLISLKTKDNENDDNIKIKVFLNKIKQKYHSFKINNKKRNFRKQSKKITSLSPNNRSEFQEHLTPLNYLNTKDPFQNDSGQSRCFSERGWDRKATKSSLKCWSPEETMLISMLKDKLLVNQTQFFRSPRVLEKKYERIQNQRRMLSRNEVNFKPVNSLIIPSEPQLIN